MRIAARLILCLSLGAASPAAAERIAATDFAFGLELARADEQDGDADLSLHAFELPESVLSALVDRELGDLCVFDARGEQLAHGLSVMASDQVEPPSLTEVTSYFPIEAQSEARTGDVELTVQRDADGSITRAYSRPIVENQRQVTGYLVDLSSLAGSMSFDALVMPLHADHDFSVEVAIEASDDLTSFRPLTTATLAHFERAEQALRRELVEFASTRAPYLRVSFLEPPPGLTLESMKVRARPVPRPATRRAIELTASPLSSDSVQQYLFELKGAYRPDRYDLRLPASTALIEAELESGPTEVGPFHPLDRALFRRGVPNERPLARSEDTFYRLRVANKGGGVRGGAPTLRLGYAAPRLLLVAEGNDPYLLAYGSGAARCKQFEEDALRSLGHGELPRGDTLRVVRSRRLGGEALLSKPEKPRSPRVFLLWTVLMVAVGVLAIIARKLLGKV